MAKKAERFLVMRSGERIPVLKEDGKFYVCDGRRFRKGNPDIQKVETVKKKKEEGGE